MFYWGRWEESCDSLTRMDDHSYVWCWYNRSESWAMFLRWKKYCKNNIDFSKNGRYSWDAGGGPTWTARWKEVHVWHAIHNVIILLLKVTEQATQVNPLSYWEEPMCVKWMKGKCRYYSVQLNHNYTTAGLKYCQPFKKYIFFFYFWSSRIIHFTRIKCKIRLLFFSPHIETQYKQKAMKVIKTQVKRQKFSLKKIYYLNVCFKIVSVLSFKKKLQKNHKIRTNKKYSSYAFIL